MTEWGWSADFADKFIANYWEQHPGVFDYPSAKWLVTLGELYTALINMPSRGPSDRFWIAKKPTPEVYDDFRMLQGEDIDRFGPNNVDGDLLGFFERMAPRCFGINIHNLGSGLPAIDQRMDAIVESLIAHGLPQMPKPRRWVSDTFFGTYYTTPFGIHCDPASVFALLLHGERTYYSWPMDYFRRDSSDLYKPGLKWLNKHIDVAEVFKVRPGQLFYWPSNRWHVATSDGQPSAVVQVSAYFDQNDLDQGV